MVFKVLILEKCVSFTVNIENKILTQRFISLNIY